MIPTWIVNKATKTFAPKLLENLIRVGPKYGEWKAANKPEFKPWIAEGERYWWDKSAATEEKSEKSDAARSPKSGKKSSSKSAKKSASPRSPRKKKGAEASTTEEGHSDEK